MQNRNEKIVITDDSAFMRKVLIVILEGIGFMNFIECSDGEECLKVCEEENPDLVLLDIIMPKVSGIEFLKKRDPSIKVLVISAVGQEQMIKNLGCVSSISARQICQSLLILCL